MTAAAVAPLVDYSFISRPTAPAVVAELAPQHFEPSPTLENWIRHTFIREGATLYNPDHQHLEHAHIGVLWTNIPYRHHQRWLVATAEIPNIQGGEWKRGRHTQQLEEWFKREPDFLLTFYAPTMSRVGDRAFCAIIEHELYHCAHATTDTGAPRFRRDGTPIFAIRGHDIEEFTGVVRRYGAIGGTREFIGAARGPSEVSDALLEAACGTCARKV